MNLNKGISTPLAILIIVVVAAVAAVTVWQFRPTEESAPKQASDYTTQAACEGADYYWFEDACHEELSETADWDTYTNKEYGFKINYPSELTARDWADETPNMELLVYIGENKQIGDGAVVIVSEEDIDNFQQLYNNSWQPTIEPGDLKNATIGKNNYDAKKFSYEESIEGVTANIISYYLEHGDNLLKLQYDKQQESPILRKDFDQMLSTFEFIEPEEEIGTSNWKTYKNEKYGFKFKYPPVPTGCWCEVHENNEEFSVNRTSLSIENSEGLNLSDFVDKETEYFEVTKRERKSIGGKEAILVDYRFGGMNRFGNAAFVKKNENIFVFNFTAGGSCCNSNEIDGIYEMKVYNAMLSTSKFIE